MEYGSYNTNSYEDYDPHSPGFGDGDGRQSQGSFFTRLTGRGSEVASSLADSWFGLGGHEEQALDGPSLLERRLLDDLDPYGGAGLLPPADAQALPLWDIDVGFRSAPAAFSSSPPVPPRSLRTTTQPRYPHYHQEDLSNNYRVDVDNDGHDMYYDQYMLPHGGNGTGGGYMDFEMELLPPLPDRTYRPPSVDFGEQKYSDAPEEGEDGYHHHHNGAAAAAPPRAAGQGTGRKQRPGQQDNVTARKQQQQQHSDDFWTDNTPAAPPNMRPQPRGRGKGAPEIIEEPPTRGSGRARQQPRGGATLRNITTNASVPVSAHKKQVAGPAYWPVFILLVTIADIGALITEIVWNGGLESFQVNPFFGPSSQTLKTLGAKWTLAILEDNEAWRLFTAMFLHVGILHLLINIVVQLRLGWTLERQIGFWRIGPIYILSGFAGSLTSCIFLPTNITVGASGAVFGLAGVLIADLILNWAIVERPYLNAIFLVVGLAAALAVGLLPGLDNFSHIGGLIQGFLLGLVLLPSLAARVKHCYRLLRWLIILLVPPINAVIIAVGLVVLYYDINPNDPTWCPVCITVDCIPVLSWCTYGSA